MSDQKGFIQIHRKLLKWEWWDDHNVTRLFIYCLLKANWKDVNWRGHDIKRGSFIASYGSLAKETGLTTKQVRSALNKLKKTNEVAHETNRHFSIISIVKYDLYQSEGQTDGQSEGRQRADKGQQVNKGNNIKKVGYQGDEKSDQPETQKPTNQPNFILLTDFAEAIPSSWADWGKQHGLSEGDIIAEAKKLAERSRAKGADKITFRQWKAWLQAEIKYRKDCSTGASTASTDQLQIEKPVRKLARWEQAIADEIGVKNFIAWCDGAELDGSTLIVENAFKKSYLEQHYDQKLKRAGVTEVKHQGGKG